MLFLFRFEKTLINQAVIIVLKDANGARRFRVLFFAQTAEEESAAFVHRAGNGWYSVVFHRQHHLHKTAYSGDGNLDN